MNQINYAIEPNRLKLIWQSSGPVRTRFTVGELIRADDKICLSYTRFNPDFAAAQSVGFSGHPAFRLETPVHHQNVLDVFSRRLPSRSRVDFSQYLSKHRLSLVPNISNFALLGYTGGRLPGDGFSFAIDFLYENFPHQFLMEVAGFRYNAGMHVEISELEGQYVTFEIDDQNQHDQFAVKVTMPGIVLGYVPRYYAPLMRFWLQVCHVGAVVERIDGTLTKPQVNLLVYVISKQPGKLK